MCTYHIDELRESQSHLDGQPVRVVSHGPDEAVVIGEEIVVQSLSVRVRSGCCEEPPQCQQPCEAGKGGEGGGGGDAAGRSHRTGGSGGGGGELPPSRGHWVAVAAVGSSNAPTRAAQATLKQHTSLSQTSVAHESINTASQETLSFLLLWDLFSFGFFICDDRCYQEKRKYVII